jgi:hypothetical protein
LPTRPTHPEYLLYHNSTMRSSIIIIAAALGLAAAAPIDYIRPKLPRNGGSDGGLNIDVADFPLAGQAVSDLVDALPVDLSLDAPVLPGKRDPAVNVDLEGLGLSLKRDPAVDVDLEGLGLALKRDPAVDVDLEGLGLALKRDPAVDVDLEGLGLALKRDT